MKALAEARLDGVYFERDPTDRSAIRVGPDGADGALEVSLRHVAVSGLFGRKATYALYARLEVAENLDHQYWGVALPEALCVCR